MTIKAELRKLAMQILKDLPLERKKSASLDMKNFLIPLLRKESLVLSFSSLPFEIDTYSLNKQLILEKKLALPKIEGKELEVYKVSTIKNLKPSPFEILEPDPEKEIKVFLKDITTILVPALLFDKFNHRLGHGFGYYDKLLKKTKAKTIGIGFLEQLHSPFLPSTSLDVSLNEVYLF